VLVFDFYIVCSLNDWEKLCLVFCGKEEKGVRESLIHYGLTVLMEASSLYSTDRFRWITESGRHKRA